jgi:hypothetical protein
MRKICVRKCSPVHVPIEFVGSTLQIYLT